MSKHEQSRKKWEQEFRDLQENVLEEDRWRNCDTLLNRPIEPAVVEQGTVLLRCCA